MQIEDIRRISEESGLKLEIILACARHAKSKQEFESRIAWEIKAKEIKAEGGSWLRAPCACNECRAGQRGELKDRYGIGHYQCEVCPPDLLEAEQQRKIGAIYHDGRWRWLWLNEQTFPTLTDES